MQLLPILLVAVIMAVDGGLRPIGADWRLGHLEIALLSIGPTALIVLMTVLATVWCDRRLSRGQFPGPLISADRIGRYARLLIAGNHMAAVLVFGWLDTVRAAVGNPILLDEFIALLPALLGLAGTWWAYYPIDRRLHQATLVRQLDDGRPVYPPLSRSGFVLLQVRMQMLLLLVPVLMIAGMSEAIQRVGYEHLPPSSHWIMPMGKIVAAACVFMLAPLIARFMLDVTPMSAGPLRESLIDVCKQNKVKIRQLLVWNTNGSIFNAAVMGIVGRLRYVMITDALLETMEQDQVRAVMAHEIGHVRRHHLPWLVGCMMASFVLAMYMIVVPLRLLSGAAWLSANEHWLTIAVGVAQLVGALTIFGWVCRRFERQADTFAVQHLSVQPLAVSDQRLTAGEMKQGAMGRVPDGTVTAQAVHTMCAALDSIARLNTIDPNRPSWRHGSIAWRMSYLFSIVGLPVTQLPIDRTVRLLKMAAAALLLFAFGHELIFYWQGGTFS